MLKKILKILNIDRNPYTPLEMLDISTFIEEGERVIYSVEPCEIYNQILKPLSAETEILLNEKGFETKLKGNESEKIVLLITEISELADCIKKGKSSNEIGFELADIVIRACNFLLADENKENIKYVTGNLNSIFSSETKIRLNLEPDITKYILIHSMHMVSYELMEILAGIENAKLSTVDFVKMLEKIIVLTAICMAFSEVFCGEFLQYFINGKMNHNFKRPYKYNTVEECR